MDSDLDHNIKPYFNNLIIKRTYLYVLSMPYIQIARALHKACLGFLVSAMWSDVLLWKIH